MNIPCLASGLIGRNRKIVVKLGGTAQGVGVGDGQPASYAEDRESRQKGGSSGSAMMLVVVVLVVVVTAWEKKV